MSVDINTQAKIQLWRQKARDGTLTIEEQREIIATLRQGRLSAAQASAKAKASKAKSAPNSDDLLSELDNL